MPTKTRKKIETFTASRHSWSDDIPFPIVETTRRARKKTRREWEAVAREWQVECYDFQKDKRLRIINAPMGSGKSWEMCLQAAYHLNKNRKSRVVIAVPQTVIGNGFLDNRLVMPGTGEKIHWRPEHNLCDPGFLGTVDSLIQFLGNRQVGFNSRILVCTHATLVAAFKRLKAEGRTSLIKNVMLWIDEAHHVQDAEMESQTGAAASAVFTNQIGEVAKHFIYGGKDLVLGLSTATFFRGDQTRLLGANLLQQFSRYNLPYDVYLKSMKHLRDIEFQVMLYDQDYMPALKKLLKLERRKTLFYNPRPNSRASRSSLDKTKYDDVEDIRKILNQVYGRQKPAHKWLDFIDDTKDREACKAFTRTINDDRDAVDLITAIGMFQEGADWRWAERAIVAGPRQSPVELIQTVGRLFRDAPGKESVKIIQLLPFTIDQSDRASFREALNNNLKAIMACMMLIDVIMPDPMKPKRKAKGPKGPQGETPVHAIDFFEDESDYTNFGTLARDEMLKLAHESDGQAGKDEYIETVADLVQKKMPTLDEEDVDFIAKSVVRNFWKLSQSMKGISVEHIDFDLVKDVNPVEWVVDFTSHACGIKTFEKLRVALSQDGRLPMPYRMLDPVTKKEVANGNITSIEGFHEFRRRKNAEGSVRV